MSSDNKVRHSNQLTGGTICRTTPWAIAHLLLATGFWVSGSLEPIAAQPPTADPMSNVVAQAPSTANQLYVNPDRGNDRQGEGTAQSPFKTITHALRNAPANTTIILAPGTYSADTGESFPLELKRGVTISGVPDARGRGVMIQGGGTYISRTVARQNVTTIAADKATLTGVTISNPNRRGYGLWIESSSPTIINNTFTGSTQDGIFVAGNGSPTISENNFVQNGANGITINGTAKPEVRDNSFERTGFGINVLQQATPLLISNQIRFNKEGVVVQGSSRPVLRNNLIEGNERSGLVAISNALPDLGYSGEPGGNIFRNNREYDINGEAAKEIISAFGNEMARDRTAGRIDVAGVVNRAASSRPVAQAPRRRPAPVPSASSPRPTNGADSFPTPRTPERSNPRPAQSGRTETPIPVPTRGYPINIPVPPPQSGNVAPPRSNSNPRRANRGDSLPVLLPVPDPNAPLGNGGATSQPVASRGPVSSNEPPLPNRIEILGLRYRVTVDAPTTREQNRVRSVVPEAFSTILNNRTVMQVGIFRSAKNANEIVDTLNRNGIRATIEELE